MPYTHTIHAIYAVQTLSKLVPQVCLLANRVNSRSINSIWRTFTLDLFASSLDGLTKSTHIITDTSPQVRHTATSPADRAPHTTCHVLSTIQTVMYKQNVCINPPDYLLSFAAQTIGTHPTVCQCTLLSASQNRNWPNYTVSYAAQN